MAYVRIGEDNTGIGCGCGPSCGCASCRRTFSGLGEHYIKDEEDEKEQQPEAPQEPSPPEPEPTPPQPEAGPEAGAGAGGARGRGRGRGRRPGRGRRLTRRPGGRLGHFGFGSWGLGGPNPMYVYGRGFAELPAPPAPAPAPAAPAPPAGPVFRFECPAGCHQGAEAVCRRVLFQALADAIQLCSGAASQLEASPRSTRTRNIFRSLFGHDPSLPVPWAGGKESGAIVAHRLRKVAEAIHGRVTHFHCGGFPGAPANLQCPPAVNAIALPPNLIVLCPRFWNLEPFTPPAPAFPPTLAGPDREALFERVLGVAGLAWAAPTPAARARVARFWRAGIVLHEMLHLLFRGFFRHFAVPPNPDDPQERRRDNAHCYAAFAWLVNRHVPYPFDVVPGCLDRPV